MSETVLNVTFFILLNRKDLKLKALQSIRSNAIKWTLIKGRNPSKFQILSTVSCCDKKL